MVINNTISNCSSFFFFLKRTEQPSEGARFKDGKVTEK